MPFCPCCKRYFLMDVIVASDFIRSDFLYLFRKRYSMNRLTFIQLCAENKDNCVVFEQLMWQYTKELDKYQDRTTPTDFIAKWIDSIIQIQGDRDRHLELCYDNRTLIGFLYGKIDHPEHKGYTKVGYGYIMEFFVLPEYRRNGYGKEMYLRLEKLFRQDGAKRMYLTSNPVTGDPFWESLGFVNTGEKSPENGKEIYERQIFDSKGRMVKIIKYPDDIILSSVTKRHGEKADEVIRGLTNTISTAHYHSDFFSTIMYGSNDEIIGYANFFQSSSEPSKWFYGDLWIAPKYRCQGLASEIVSTGWQHLSELNAKVLLCTVDPHNEVSLNLHRSLGFTHIETEPFEDFEVDGLVMFKKNIPMNYNIIPLADDINHLCFICDLLTHPSNVSALHLKRISDNEYRQFYREMKEALILSDADDELNYIIRKGVVPIAWLKLNGLSEDSLWISMLVVHEKYRNLGVGTFALNCVEEFAFSTQRKHIYINTTADNIIAQSLYKKAGYIVMREAEYQNEDETKLLRYTLHKEI